MTAPVAKPRAPRAPKHDRLHYLGGSEVAAVMGLSPWQTPVELFLEKTGRAAPRKLDPARERILNRGKKLEPIVRAMVVDKLRERGLTVELVKKNGRYFDTEFPWMTVEIDFELRLLGVAEINGVEVAFDGELVNGDCKTVTGFARKKWGDEDTEDVPIEYAAQFMQGLGVTGRDRCLVAALIGLDDVAIYWVNRDDVTIPAMRAKCVDFWTNHVLTDVPPDPFKFSDIKALYPVDNGRTVEATPEVADAARELRRIGMQIDQLDARRERLRVEVGEYLEDFRTLTIDGRPAYSLAHFESKRVDVKALRRQHPGLVELFTERTPARALQPNRGFRG